MREEIIKRLYPITEKNRKVVTYKKGINIRQDINWKGCDEDGEKLFLEGRLISLCPHPQFVHFSEHSSDHVQVIYMCRGMTTHIINGETITLREGELLLLTPNLKREILPASEKDIAVNFIIMPLFFETIIQMIEKEQIALHSYFINILRGDDETSAYMLFKVSDVLQIQNLVENLIWTLVNVSENKPNIIQSTMMLLLFYLFNCTDRIVCKKDEKVILSVLQYIESYYKKGSLTDFAQSMHYDFTWLSRKIKSRTGKTFTELVQDKRLSQANFLLRNTPMKVDNIANKIGYDNISYFYRLFKNKFGVSPKQYREGTFDCKKVEGLQRF